MSVTDYRNAAYWYCQGKNYLLFDTKRKAFLCKGNQVTDFRGDTDVIKSVTRGPDYNGTGKVAVVGRLGERYSGVFDLEVLPAIEEGKVYQLDIYDRDAMVRHLELVRVTRIDDDQVVNVVDEETGNHYFLDWRDIYIANEVGVHDLIPVQ